MRNPNTGLTAGPAWGCCDVLRLGRIIHPLFVFNQFGDLERCALRPGNVHSADQWEGVLKPVVARYQGKISRIYFRADAGFANPEVYEYLEAEGIKYAIRLPANRSDELYPRVGFIVTNMARPPENVVTFYNKRGTCEQWIKEGKGAIRWTRLA